MDAQYLRVTKMMAAYYRQVPEKPKKRDWERYLDILVEPMKSSIAKVGFSEGKTRLNFIRFYKETKNLGMRDFMRENLAEEDLKYYLEIIEKV